MFIKISPFLFLIVTSCEKRNNNKIVAEDPLPYMVVGNKWVYDVALSGARDTVTFEIVDEVDKVFEIISYNQTDTTTRFWFVHDGFLKSYFEGQSMRDAELFSISNPTVGEKFYYALNKGRWSSEPIKDDRLGTFEVVRTSQNIVAAGHPFSDVFVIEITYSFDTTKYERSYSESYGFLSSTELQSFTLISINF